MTAAEIQRLASDGEVQIIDVRPVPSYSGGHAPGALSAPFNRQTWAPAVAQWADRNAVAVVLFGDNAVIMDAAQKALAERRVIPRAVWSQGTEVWRQEGGIVVAIRQITVEELHRELADHVVIDVREPYEWRSGIIPGALKIPLGQLREHLQELDPHHTYAVVCAHGSRSQAGASFLADQGYTAGSVVGGMAIWLSSRYPVDQD